MQKSIVNNQELLVSIIIPVYNKEPFIQYTLDSALEQTYLNIEIILINDGSTDGSLEILKKYSEKYPEKITLIDQENQGVSSVDITVRIVPPFSV
jgi:glycosyltransferase EpsH